MKRHSIALFLALLLGGAAHVTRIAAADGDLYVAFGEKAGLVVASALLVDYVMTVVVSVASGVDNIISAFPDLNPWRVEIAALTC